MQVETITAYAVETLGLSRFAVLYPDDTYGHTFMNLFWDDLLRRGGKIVGLEAYDPELTDFADPIQKLVGRYYDVPEDLKPLFVSMIEDMENAGIIPKEEPADESTGDQVSVSTRAEEESEPRSIVDFEAIFIPEEPKKAGLIVPQLAFYDIKNVLLFGTNLWHTPTLIEMAEQYVQGAMMPDAFYAESPSDQVTAFVEIFEQTYQEKPGFIEAVIYDSALMLFEVVSTPNIRYRSEIRDELLNLDFQGVTGATRFDSEGEALKELHLLRIKGRRFVELEQY
jgi:ABC-type branched-subunit amino acid transport system substrate-binding protein